MGKVLGGGSSINVLAWVRGHASDWDYFAAETGDARWASAQVDDLFRSRIEDWSGPADPTHRGVGGPVSVQPPLDPNPAALAMLAAASGLGIPTFTSHNQALRNGGGAGLQDKILKDGQRRSMYRAYVAPLLHQSNLTVCTDAVVTRLILEGDVVIGVDVHHRGEHLRIGANGEVVLSLGALNTPKLLMQSGIGDRAKLNDLGIDVVQNLPGVGQNFQDHIQVGCTWEYKKPVAPRNSGGEASLFWKSDSTLDAPDLILFQAEVPVASEQTAALGVPEHGWTMFSGIVRPSSRGTVSLTGAASDAPLRIETGALTSPEDEKTLLASMTLAREIGNAPEMNHLNKREAMPGNLKGPDLMNYVRNAASTFWHQSCTAKMGRDSMSVVDGSLAVYGIKRLRIADASVMPRITTGNTMAPCVVIGELAARSICDSHKL